MECKNTHDLCITALYKMYSNRYYEKHPTSSMYYLFKITNSWFSGKKFSVLFTIIVNRMYLLKDLIHSLIEYHDSHLHHIQDITRTWWFISFVCLRHIQIVRNILDMALDTLIIMVLQMNLCRVLYTHFSSGNKFSLIYDVI